MLELSMFRFEGVAQYVRVRSATMDKTIVREVYREYLWPRLADADIRTAIDIGAHVGAWTKRLRHEHPNARVIAVEPEEANALTSQLNCFGDPMVTILHGYCGYLEDERVLVRSRINSGGHVVASRGKADALNDPGRIAALPTRFEIETLIDKLATERVDLLKLDCEGAELEIIEHVSDEALAKIDRIIGEHHQPQEKFHRAAGQRLADAGMTVEYVPHPRGHIGLFYAIRPRSQ